MVVLELFDHLFILETLDSLTLLHGLQDRKSDDAEHRENTAASLHHGYRLFVNENGADKPKESRALADGGDDANVLPGLGGLVIGREDHEVAQEVEHAAYVR